MDIIEKVASDSHGVPAGERLGHLSFRMGLLAFLSFNLTMASMWGSFGVLLTAIEAKMGVGREASSLAASIVMVAVALLAPLAGALLSRISLRLLMMGGSAMGLAGFALLAVANNIQMLLLVYGLLIGPAVCLCGVVLPAALVSRWFTTGRGRALGFVTIPIAMAVAPLACAFVVRAYGLSAVYMMLAATMALNFIAQAFVQDHPPRTDGGVSGVAKGVLGNLGLTTGELVRQKRFWPIAMAYSANIAGTMMLSAHLVPMATGWGDNSTQAASLLTLMSLAGMLGPPIFGWLADRFGGRRMQVILCVNSAALWGVLLTQPPFPIVAMAIALFGLHSAGSVPAFGVALAEQFGQANFARAFGLGNLASLPFTVLAIPLAASVYVRTGSYGEALLIQCIFFVAAAVLLLVMTSGKRLSPLVSAAIASKAGTE
jgi:MFS family permease